MKTKILKKIREILSSLSCDEGMAFLQALASKKAIVITEDRFLQLGGCGYDYKRFCNIVTVEELVTLRQNFQKERTIWEESHSLFQALEKIVENFSTEMLCRNGEAFGNAFGDRVSFKEHRLLQHLFAGTGSLTREAVTGEFTLQSCDKENNYESVVYPVKGEVYRYFEEHRERPWQVFFWADNGTEEDKKIRQWLVDYESLCQEWHKLSAI
jgi:hypothetical protein